MSKKQDQSSTVTSGQVEQMITDMVIATMPPGYLEMMRAAADVDNHASEGSK